MTGNERGRPRHRTGLNVDSTAGASTTLPAAGDISVQLDRRRSAALRLPPLEDGRRDPWLVPRPPLSVASARAAWLHLYELGLMSETVDRVLRDAAREAA